MIVFKFTCKSQENNRQEHDRAAMALSSAEAWGAFSYERERDGLLRWAFVCAREGVIDREYDEYHRDFVESLTDGRGPGSCAMSVLVMDWHNSIEEKNNG